MDSQQLADLLRQVAEGTVTPQGAAERIRLQPYEEMDYAKIDLNRALRTGHGEAVFCLGKSPAQAAGILRRMCGQDEPALPILATKASREHYEAVREQLGADFLDARRLALEWHEAARMIVVRAVGASAGGIGSPHDPGVQGGDPRCVTVVTAGTADVPVAEEAALTAELYGHRVERVYDVGVAGLHRLLDKLGDIRRGSVVVVVAGMEGALASVVAGLVEAPVIAVPTSVGYGVTLGGLTPLFSMLGSCSLGIGVMNIDNGFGAGHFASMLLEMPRREG
ncbi:MAG: nickel pincer cofactor biosynthesis protein LarB [Clostridiales Family XIII bacterium]|jgi:NCAIR mutase (PurE)-related protein|nr:nickel pincer cofactor biosynthesis protein LarB [Clostridiales Family XIII bacterium]